MADVAPGTVIDGRYQVLERLGSGGMADVYCASDEQLGRKVALKLLYPRFAEDQEFVERFRREASSAAGLQHPHVVSVFDRGEWNGTYYIAMEYMEGRSLKTVVGEEAPLDPVRAIDLVIQILGAARFAHQRGIIHRDLKPHNVMVDAEGQVKVTDFGIARAGASDVTQTGSIVGTAQYLSPEQAQGQAVSAASDLYSIGIVLYELLTGQVPFDGPNAVTIALRQVSEAPPPASAVNPAVTPELDAVVLRALEKDPAYRFAAADEFIAALEHARAGLLAPVGPSTAEFTAIAAEPTVLAAPPVYEHHVIEEPVVAPVDGRRWPWVALLLALLAALALAYVLFFPSNDRRVPNVVGQPYSRARATLRRAGFRPIERRSTSATVSGGHVITTAPKPRASVGAGSKVTVYVSSGPAATQVPKLVGLGRAAALRLLARRGLKAREVSVRSDTVAPHQVVSSSPRAGSRVRVGTAVTIRVSSGRATAAVPSVVGQAETSARAQLGAAGFAVSTVHRESTQTPGTVLAQSPAGSSSAQQGSTVTLTLASPPTTKPVPAVVGLSENDAINQLSAAGFTPHVVNRNVTDSSQDGKVLNQSPGAGRKTRRGATINITVGHFHAPRTTPTTTTPPTTPTNPGGP